jgi:hypothetical protein
MCFSWQRLSYQLPPLNVLVAVNSIKKVISKSFQHHVTAARDGMIR